MKIERDNGTYAWEYSIKFYAYYEVDRRPDGDATRLKEIAPIWAEFHMWFSDDEEELQMISMRKSSAIMEYHTTNLLQHREYERVLNVQAAREGRPNRPSHDTGQPGRW